MLIGSTTIVETLFSAFQEEEDSSTSFINLLLVVLSLGMGKRLFSLLFFFFLPSLEGLDLDILGHHSSSSNNIFLPFALLLFFLFLSLAFQSLCSEGFHGYCVSLVVSSMLIQRQLSPNKYPSEKHGVGQYSLFSPFSINSSKNKIQNRLYKVDPSSSHKAKHHHLVYLSHYIYVPTPRQHNVLNNRIYSLNRNSLTKGLNISYSYIPFSYESFCNFFLGGTKFFLLVFSTTFSPPRHRIPSLGVLVVMSAMLEDRTWHSKLPTRLLSKVLSSSEAMRVL